MAASKSIGCRDNGLSLFFSFFRPTTDEEFRNAIPRRNRAQVPQNPQNNQNLATGHGALIVNTAVAAEPDGSAF